MHPPLPHQMTIGWTVTSLAISADGLETPHCRDCRTELSIHQPDEDRPEHLLATCSECGAWYLIELGRKMNEAYLFDLPNVTLIRAALAAAGTATGRKRAPKPSADTATRAKGDDPAD